MVTTCLTRVAALAADRSPLFWVFDGALYNSKAEEDLNYPGGHVGCLGQKSGVTPEAAGVLSNLTPFWMWP